MKLRTFAMLPLAILFGCADKDETLDTGSTEDSFIISNLNISSAPCYEEEPPTDVLTVSVEESTVHVLHENYENSSCLSFEVSGLLENSNLTVSYTETGEPCDCNSLYQLEYEIENLPSGSYAINLPNNLTENVDIP